MLARIGLVLALVLPASAQTVQLVSQSTSGVQGNGDSRAPRISADGEWVVFKSDASTLVPGDSNGVGDVFLRHLDSGTTTLISVGLAGASANGESFSPAISADGSVIAFQSAATNLVTGDTNSKADIFVWESGVVTRVSLGTGGAQANGASDRPAVSGDGRFVAFASVASNLVTGDSNGASDIFRFDRVTDSVVRASVSSTGAEANGASHAPWLDFDGGRVTFDSLATNLVAGDTNGSSDVFVRSPSSGWTLSASVFPGVVGNGNSDTASISADGQYVAFRSDASNLTAGDTNGTADVFLADPLNQQIGRVSEGSGGVQGNGTASFPQIAPDGLFVAFSSAASNLVAGDTNGRDDVFVRDVAAAKTKRVSVDAYGVAGNSHSRAPTIASGGWSTAFKSDASNLIVGDTNGTGDVFLRRMGGGVWYVDAAGQPTGAGSASDPFPDLHAALGNPLLGPGDVIFVAPGTYTGGYQLPPFDLKLRSTGGPGEVVLDGNGTTTIIAAQPGVWPGPSYEFYGLTLRNGAGSSCNWSECGLGGAFFLLDECHVSLTDCVITTCTANKGAGIYAEGESVIVELRNCSVSGNAGTSIVEFVNWGWMSYLTVDSCSINDNAGSAIVLWGANTWMTGSEVARNTVLPLRIGMATTSTLDHSSFIDNGGGISLYATDGTMDHCQVVGNGWGIAFGESTYWDLIDSDFVGNDGAIDNYEGVINITRCRIDSNHGAIASGPMWYYAHATVTETSITRNSDWSGWGSPIYVDYKGFLSLDRCTVAGNTGATSGLFALSHADGYERFAMTNCIAVANVPNAPVPTPPANAAINWSDLGFAFAGNGCINVDPQLWDAAGGDVHLLPGSPCIDAGDPAASLDPDGSRADMGAIPFDPNYCGTPRVYCTAKVNSLGCTPSMGWTGTPSLTGPNDDFHVAASIVLNNKNGLLFWGTTDFGAPFQGGTLCVKPPIVRTDVQNSGGNPPPNDCSGSYDFHLSQAYMQQSLFQVGTTIYAQYWSRDPGFSPPNNIGLTDALRVVVCP